MQESIIVIFIVIVSGKDEDNVFPVFKLMVTTLHSISSVDVILRATYSHKKLAKANAPIFGFNRNRCF